MRLLLASKRELGAKDRHDKTALADADMQDSGTIDVRLECGETQDNDVRRPTHLSAGLQPFLETPYTFIHQQTLPGGIVKFCVCSDCFLTFLNNVIMTVLRNYAQFQCREFHNLNITICNDDWPSAARFLQS